MIVVKSFIVLAVAVAVQAEAQNSPNGMGMRMHKRNDPTMEKRVARAVARLGRRNPGLGDIIFPGTETDNGTTSDTSTTSTATTTTTTTSRDPPPPTTPTTSRQQDTTTTTSTTSQTPTTTSTSTSTSTSTTSSTSTSTTSSSTTKTSTSSTPTLIAITRTSQDTYAGISFATQTTVAPASQTSAADPSTDNSDSSSGSSTSKTAIVATASIAAIVILGALIFLGIWWRKKSQRGKMGEEDMWDEASMKEFSQAKGMAGAPIIAPPTAARNLDLEDELGGAAAGGIARSNTKVLPSQSAYAAGGAGLARSRSQHQQDPYEEPDELLAMPPVAHYERPRDSAYDIVPAGPPTNAYASASGGQAGYPNQGYGYSAGAASGSGGGYGTSGGLAPPLRKGDHTSFDQLGSDPFAGSRFVDANRESTYGPGQAGRGAGFATGNTQGSVQGAGSQWPQGYNPYTGYSQGSQAPYGGYGYAS